MRTAVVILNWNGQHLLDRFLPGVVQHSPEAEVYVIDNASTDGSVSLLQSKFSSVRLICLAANKGYAGGYNEGLKQVPADHFILLNSDVEVTSGWIPPLIRLLEQDKEAAACQPKMMNQQVRDEFEYAGGGGGFIDKWGYPFCRGRIFNSFEKDHGQYDDRCEIFWASGACLSVRASVFHEAGGFDEDFFAHMEEIDLCWRIRNLGYRIVYEPQSVVYHVGAGTLAKMSPAKTFYNFRNNLLLLTKNHAPGYFALKLFLRGSLDGLAGIKFLVAGDFAHFLAVIRAHFSYYSLLGRMLARRREIRKKIRRYCTTCVYRGSIVWAYFFAGKRKFSELRSDLF